MGNLLTRTVPFFASVKGEVAHQVDLGVNYEKIGAESRVIKALAYNEGDVQVTLILQGSANGTSWSNISTAVVPAKGKAILSGAITPSYKWMRIYCSTSSGDSLGRIEIFDESDAFKR
mgnify:CR=1 FL=1